MGPSCKRCGTIQDPDGYCMSSNCLTQYGIDLRTKPQRRYCVRPAVTGGAWLHIQALSDLEDMTHGQFPEFFELKVVMMTDAEVKAIGDFGGW